MRKLSFNSAGITMISKSVSFFLSFCFSYFEPFGHIVDLAGVGESSHWLRKVPGGKWVTIFVMLIYVKN